MTVSQKTRIDMEQSSWIRKMFEEGARLKELHGADNVFDFSLGNPNVPPPDEFSNALRDVVSTCEPGSHCYMPQPGYPQICQSVAALLSREKGVAVEQKDILMTCGAAGALNVIFKALIDPGDEVIVPSPCFMDYKFYIENHGGVTRMVPTREDFTLDIDTIAAAITKKTKAVLINSPNNPTGQIYSAEDLDIMGKMLRDKCRDLDHIIYLISDEPYRKIVFDNREMPSIFGAYKQSIIASSYSKTLSVPGERIGCAAVHPGATHATEIMAAMAFTIRILGFVNAPALMQRVIADIQGTSVDISSYARKRELLCTGLADAGYDFLNPPGAFYFFPRTPIEDDVAFVDELRQELILTVPGSGFALPGYFRIAFCVADKNHH
jgi:aspartate aminotransferase